MPFFEIPEFLAAVAPKIPEFMYKIPDLYDFSKGGFEKIMHRLAVKHGLCIRKTLFSAF